MYVFIKYMYMFEIYVYYVYIYIDMYKIYKSCMYV